MLKRMLFLLFPILLSCESELDDFNQNELKTTQPMAAPGPGGDDVGPTDPLVFLAFDNVTKTSISMSWEDIGTSSVTGFDIMRDGAKIAELAPNVWQYTDTPLSSCQLYSYKVAMKLSGSKPVFSKSLSTTTTCDLVAPSNLQSPSQSLNTITLAWSDNSNNEDGFYMKRNNVTVATLNANTTSYTDTGLTSDTQYSYAIEAFNAFETVSSSSITATTLTVLTLLPPERLRIERGTSDLYLDWRDSNTDEEGFRIIRDGVIVKTLPPNSTSYHEESELIDTREYCYEVEVFKSSVTARSELKCANPLLAFEINGPEVLNFGASALYALNITSGAANSIRWYKNNYHISHRDGMTSYSTTGASASFTLKVIVNGVEVTKDVCVRDKYGNGCSLWLD